MMCHSCGSPAFDRKTFGSLCHDCWRRVFAILSRVLQRWFAMWRLA